jgi:hypothetical protein
MDTIIYFLSKLFIITLIIGATIIAIVIFYYLLKEIIRDFRKGF